MSVWHMYKGTRCDAKIVDWGPARLPVTLLIIFLVGFLEYTQLATLGYLIGLILYTVEHSVYGLADIKEEKSQDSGAM